MSSAKQFVLSFLICLAAFSVIGFLIYGYFSDEFESEANVGGSGESSEYTESENKSDAVPAAGKSVAALIVGRDLSNNEPDALIIIKADRATKKILASSIPPDAEYAITGTDSSGNSYSGSMSFRDTYKEYGIDYLVNKLYALTDVKIDYYAVMSAGAARNLIDTFCGSEGLRYTVPEKMEYEDTVTKANINLYEGDQYLDGANAVEMLRYRSYKSGNGDVKRCTTHIDFIREFTAAMLSSENPLKEKLLDETERSKLLSNITTNATAADIYDNLDLAFSLSEYEFIALPFRYGSMIRAENVSSLHADYNTPFDKE